MKDTNPKIEKIYREMLMQRSNEERFLMGCSMFDSAKRMVESSLRRQNPKISKSELRKQTFLRFYKNDFTSEQLAKILSKLKF